MANEGGDGAGLIEIEVAYAKPEEQVIVTLYVSQGTTLQQAAELSGLLSRFPELSIPALKLGIFGSAFKPEQIVKQGDRVEIYRSLIHDPKDARRHRALKS